MDFAGQRIISCAPEDIFKFWGVGDVHLGNIGCAEDLFDSTITRIRDDPNARFVGTGDYIDCISTKDKRYDPACVAEKHRKAYFEHYGPSMRDYLIEKFRPIKDKCVGLLHGNHEFSFETEFDQAIVQDVCSALEIPFLGYCAMFDLVFDGAGGSKKIRVIAHHGASWAATIGGKINALARFMETFVGDLYMMGHVHDQLTYKAIQIAGNEECTGPGQVRRAGVICGTFLRTYTANSRGVSTYGERRMYKPTALGSPRVVIDPVRGPIGYEEDW